MKTYVENLIDCLNEKVHGCKYLYHFLFIEKSSCAVKKISLTTKYCSVFPTHFLHTVILSILLMLDS